MHKDVALCMKRERSEGRKIQNFPPSPPPRATEEKAKEEAEKKN